MEIGGISQWEHHDRNAYGWKKNDSTGGNDRGERLPCTSRNDWQLGKHKTQGKKNTCNDKQTLHRQHHRQG